MEALNLTPFKGFPFLMKYSLKDRTVNLCNDKPIKVGDKVILHGKSFSVKSILEKRKAKGNWTPVEVPDFYILSLNLNQ